MIIDAAGRHHKAGILEFTRHLAHTVAGDGITVNASAPGPVATDPFNALRTPAGTRRLAEDAPLRWVAQSDEIAHFVLFLASPAAGYITGAALDVNGGLMMGLAMPTHPRTTGAAMSKALDIVHHADRRTDVMMPYAPGILVRRGQLLFLSGVTAAPVYHSHPHRDEEFDLPKTMTEQAVLTMENVKKTLEAAGSAMADIVWATRYLTAIEEQDDMNRVWARYLQGHLPATTTVEVARLAPHANCKIEISVIAVVEDDPAGR